VEVHHDTYANGEFHYKYVARHWMVLLALYTGARANELAQINLNEIIKKNDFYYINMLDEERNKRLKTKNSRRLVPIHPHLIELGFINYFQFQKERERKQTKLFEDLKPDAVECYHRRATDWYRVYFLKPLKENKIINDERTFHDFRNTAINEEKQDFLDERVMREIFGHKQSKDVHGKYQNAYKIETKYKEICKLDYGLDLTKIKKWVKP